MNHKKVLIKLEVYHVPKADNIPKLEKLDMIGE